MPREGFIAYNEWQFDYGYHRFMYDVEFLRLNRIYYPHLVRFQDPPFFVKAMICAQRFYALNTLTYALRCGHQKVNWTPSKVKDLLIGLNYNLKISKKHKLSKLHYLTYKRITTEFISQIKNNLSDLRVYFLFVQTSIHINTKLMKKENPNFKNEISQIILKLLREKIFSIKNTSDKKHKVITFLGWKIKYKRRKK